MTWHGGWSADIAASGFGWLVLQLPAALGYVPFVLTTTAIILVFARSAAITLALTGAGESALWRFYVPVLATVIVLGFANISRNQDLIFGAFLWQAASIVHLWPTLLSLVLLSAAFESRHKDGWKTNALFLVSTLFVAGFNFTETAILGAGAGVLGLACLVGAHWATDGRVMMSLARRYLMIALVATVCFLTMYLSPGTELRRAALPSNQMGPVEKISHFQDLVGTLAVSALGRHGMVIAIFVGLCLALSSYWQQGNRVPAKRAGAIALVLGTIGTLGIGLAAGGEFASYPAFWHSLALIPLWTIAAVGLGICLGDSLARGLEDSNVGRLTSRLSSLARVAPLVIGAILVLQLAWYAGPLSGRVAAWDRGESAPFAGAADREATWVNSCWSDVVEDGYRASRLLAPGSARRTGHDLVSSTTRP